MIRQPTSPEAAYRWYGAAIVAAQTLDPPAIDENTPEPGWYKRRFNWKGVFVPARIWIIQTIAGGELVADEILACEIGGERFDPYDVWLTMCGHPITKAEYDHLMRVREWARIYRPNEPEANPLKSVDLFTVAAPVWGKPKRKTTR